MKPALKLWPYVFLNLLVWVVGLRAQETLTGNFNAHDPSTIIKDGSRYYVFTTGSGIPSLYSTDLHAWNTGASVYPGTTPPAWATNAVPNYDPSNWNWAPDAAYFNGKFHLYYSVSSWGSIDSVIGLFTSPSLVTPTWTDQGKVVQSDASGSTQPETDTTAYNCIDPAIFVATNGTVWMTFGSYSSGILVTQIDPATGKRLNTNSLVATQIANNAGAGGWGSTIEGSFLWQRGSYYYLFVNYGGCCAGTNSTYNIRVGRSTSVTGPYLDQDGVNMKNGGGTIVLGTYRNQIGPGHAGIFSENGTNWLSYHYYPADLGGWPGKLGLRQLFWTTNDWPYVSKPGSAASAFYTFDVDARDHLAVRNGQMINSATVTNDPGRGGVLALNGVTNYVQLPNSVANGNTFAAWVKWNGGADWQRIFDFGVDTSQYLFLTPRANTGVLRFGITTGGSGGEINAPFALPTNSWCHVAVTLKAGTGVLYLNGQPVATNSSMTRRPSQILAQANYLGKSQWAADPYFNGKIDSFRVFDRAFSSSEIRDLAFAHPALAHRYSFTNGVTDSIGGADGELKGNATVSNGLLTLNGVAGNYADLPGGLVSGSSAVTLEFWATFGANGNWARVMDFGNISGGAGGNYFFFSPHNGSSGQTMEMKNNSATPVTFAFTPVLDNRTVHVVCILDPAGKYAAVYTNGVLEKSLTGTAWPALTSVGNAWSFIGRSLFSADAYLNATIDELRLYDGRLTPEEIAADFKAGPDALALPVSITQSNTPASLTLSWPAWAVGFAAQGSTNLTSWTTNGLAPALANDRWSLVISRTNALNFYRLQR